MFRDMVMRNLKPKYHVFPPAAAFSFMDIFDARPSASRFAIPIPTSFPRVLLPDITAKVGRTVSDDDDTFSASSREFSLQISP